ncbi:putative cytochrome P450 [Helianthus annuus]|nr:putative cytochrome P450 [Helianthus annuus]
MDEFYQEVIDEHLNQYQSNSINMQDDMVDILLKLKQDYSNNITFDHVKGVLMVSIFLSSKNLDSIYMFRLFEPGVSLEAASLFLRGRGKAVYILPSSDPTFNILLAGTGTSASTVVWAMTMLIKNPEFLKKVQQEVRDAVGKKGKVEEDDLYKLDYLKAVIKEALRLYPVVPLLLPRESRDQCILEGYKIPKKTLVYVNAWAVGRDPKCWNRPEEFDPERFMGSNLEYKGADFEWIPFGCGRRGCPGLLMGATAVELALSNLVYSFDWELPKGTLDIDTLKTKGTVMHKKNELLLVAKVP